MSTTRTPEEIIAEHGFDNLTGQHSKITATNIELVHALISRSEIASRLKQWKEESVKGRGGRPSHVDHTMVLTIMLLLAMEHTPLLVTRMADVLDHRLGPKGRRLLGIFGVKGTHQQWYDRIHRGLHSLLDLVDPQPGPRRKRPTPEELVQIIARRDPAEAKIKQERLDWLTNEILYLTFILADARMANWHGNMTIDATVFGVFNSRGAVRGDRVASEYDAGWYRRDADWRDVPAGAGKKIRKAVYGYDTHLVVASTNSGDSSQDDFPYLVVGMSCSVPSRDVSGYAMTAFTQTDKRHHDRIQGALATGDRGYFAAADPVNLQLPLRALGVGIVTDYRIDQLGVQYGYAGAEQVDGNWYCPGMPQGLKDATILYRNGEIDEDIWRARINQRTKYLLRPKEKPDQHGKTPMVCPAAGLNPTIKCALKALGCAASKAPEPTVPNGTLPRYPDKICTNKSSVTFEPTAGAKFAQELQFGTDEWQAMYSTSRNIVESANAHLKDESREGLGSIGRRRVRGYAAQYVFIAVLVFAANLRRIASYDKKKSNPKFTPTGPRRLSKESISDFRPTKPTWWRERGDEEPAAAA